LLLGLVLFYHRGGFAIDMKRIIVLIDGTWEVETSATNVAKLAPLIKGVDVHGVEQLVFYHDGVGAESNWLLHTLGGAIGLGLKDIVQAGYDSAFLNYRQGDEIYIFGFSRGAYAARAVAGRLGPHTPVKCVGVFDTVGSYGIPAGIGFAALARYYAQTTLGFNDTCIGEHVDVGLHALAIDEHRRPFVPTFWTCPKRKLPHAHVEQVWFAGGHAGVGGGGADSGTSDIALLWMIGRVQELTGLAFDHEAVEASTKPKLTGHISDSTVGWPIDHRFPHYRPILAGSRPAATMMHIGERVHWSALRRRAISPLAYQPLNLPWRLGDGAICYHRYAGGW
jgi:hypothetical protein